MQAAGSRTRAAWRSLGCGWRDRAVCSGVRGVGGGSGPWAAWWSLRCRRRGTVQDTGGVTVRRAAGPGRGCHRARAFCFAAAADGLQVTAPDKKKVAMLFQPTLLRCHFSTSSHQPAVVQWKFKSYCQDRMGESLGMSSPRAQALSKRNLEWDPYLDCLDSRRTVRVVASKQGSTVTLGDFYRGREITIVHGNATSALNPGPGRDAGYVPPRHAGTSGPRGLDLRGDGSIARPRKLL